MQEYQIDLHYFIGEHMHKLNIIGLIVLTSLTQNLLAQESIHVNSSQGNDSGQGTLESPFKSINAALQKSIEGSTIVLADGVYKEAVTIDKNNISIIAGGKNVVWDGTEEVELSKTSNASIYSAILAENQIPESSQVEQVFNSSKNLQFWEARWPNVAPERIWVASRNIAEGWAQAGSGTGVVNNNTARISYNGASPFRPIPGNEKVNVIFNAFSQFRTLAKEASFQNGSGGFNLTFPLDSDCTAASNSAEIAPCHQKSNPKWWTDDYFYLFGHRNLLDAPGEWHYDSSNKTLEVVLNQENPNVHVKVRPYAVTIKGAQKIKIDGIKFFATAVRVINNGQTRSNDISLTNNIFQYSSWDRMLQDNLKHVAKFAPAHPTTDGISLEGDNIRFENNLVEKAGTYGVLMDGIGNLIRNNLIRDIDWFGNLEHAPIIMINSSSAPSIPVHGKIVSNTVHNFGNVGIRFFGPQIEVAYNNVYNGGLLSLDTALIYTARAHSNGSRIHHNFVHDGTGIGIRLDGFSVTAMKIDHNVVWNVRRGMKISGFNNEVLNNTIDVDNPQYSLLVEWGEEQKGLERGGKQNRNTLIQNNLAYRIHYRDRGPAAGGKTVFGELFNNGASNNPVKRLEQCKKQ